MSADSELLTVVDAAAALGVTSQRVYQMLRTGKLKGRQVNGRRMVPVIDVARRLRVPRPKTTIERIQHAQAESSAP